MAGRPHDDGQILPMDGAQSRASRVVASGEPIKPRRLPADVSRAWDEIIPRLVELGIVGEIDSTMLLCLCEWTARYRRYMAALEKLKDGDKRIPQLTTLAAIATDKMDRIASKFGLTAKDREKLRIAKRKDDGGVMSRKRS